MYRETHTLKGAARAAGYGTIANLCQATESAYVALNQTRGPVPGPLLQALLHVHGLMYNNLRGTPADSHAAAIEALERAAAEVAPTHEPADLPDSPPPPLTPFSEPEFGPQERLANAASLAVALPESVRIPLLKLETLRLALDELLPARQAVRRLTGDVSQLLDAEQKDLSPALGNALLEVQNQLAAIENSLGMFYQRLRTSAQDLVMLPLVLLFQPLAIVVNDVAHRAHKRVELISSGGDLVIDRRILEDVREILLHIVRNAVDHGIETPAERRAVGKPETGHITVSARQLKFDSFELLIRDDGKGIDIDAVKQAGSQQATSDEQPRNDMSNEDALKLIFQPHLSTVETVNDVSGRGLGMSIVWDKVMRLKGEITVSSEHQVGTTFRLKLPVTQRSFRAMVIKSGNLEFVLPLLYVDTVLQTDTLDVRNVEGVPTIAHNGAVLPIRALSELLGYHSAGELTSRPVTVIITVGTRSIAIAIDAILAEEEFVKKSLGFPLQDAPYYEGATNTSSGTLLPILKVEALLDPGKIAAGRVAPPLPSVQSPRTRILVVDDSVTSRLFLRHVLESRGYIVEMAVDGVDAWNRLTQGEFDAVVSDVEMPRKNGFELTAQIRTERRFSTLPVILVTALAKDEDRQRGLQAGASAYIVKGGFNDTNLLEAIEKLI
jgi:two-component system chemotaxis sensor kinase CheA